MADTHDAGHADDHGHGNLFKLYMTVALILAVATATSFIFNWLARSKEDGGADLISHGVSFFGILTVAVIKAGLVGYIFMHLKWDWKFLYFLIIPVFIMGTMMATVLLPDIFFGPNKDMADGYKIARDLDEQYQIGGK